MITLLLLFSMTGKAKEKMQMLLISIGIDALYIVPNIILSLK